MNTISNIRKTMSLLIQYYVLPLLLFSSLTLSVSGQIFVPFQHRTATDSPTDTIFRLRGDFTLIGNTNVKFPDAAYSITANNDGHVMRYVDIDSDLTTFNSSEAQLTFGNDIFSCTKIVYAGLYWTGKAQKDATDHNDGYFIHTGTRTMDKRIVKFKYEGDTYHNVQATNTHIYYPTNFSTTNDIYVGFAEVTDYVKAHGIGNYFVADIACDTNGISTPNGLFGGWGMIVIYSNNSLALKDIMMFDGYAMVYGTPITIPINGLNTVQNGDVNVRLGILAAEGDAGTGNDAFTMLGSNHSTWYTLQDTSNNTIYNLPNNFFNSSIHSAGTRNPSLVNNAGIDIHMFSLNNRNKDFITNDQTTTQFKFTSVGDMYAPFLLAIAIDAQSQSTQITESVVGATYDNATEQFVKHVVPGDTVIYQAVVQYKGTATTNDIKYTVNIPYNCTFIDNAVTYSSSAITGTKTFDALSGANGQAQWTFDSLPGNFPDSIFARLTLRMKVTSDCNLLQAANFVNTVKLNGQINSGEVICGYKAIGACQGDPITNSLQLAITIPEGVCIGDYSRRSFTFCQADNTVAFTDISSQYPASTRFYNAYPASIASLEYTFSTGFPLPSTDTLYAIYPGNVGYGKFVILKASNDIPAPFVTPNLSYCQYSTAAPLSDAVTIVPEAGHLASEYTVYYYTSDPLTNATAVANPTITPETSIPGTYTYFVRQSLIGAACSSDHIATITVTVNPTLTSTNSTITCPPDQNIILPYGVCSQPVTLGTTTFQTTNTYLSSPILSNNAPTSLDLTPGFYSINWTATVPAPACGSISCTQNIVINYPPCGPGDTVTDIDGFKYPTVRVGCDCWTATNLRNTHYSDGTDIPNVTYYQHLDSLEHTFGKLYSWYSAVGLAENATTAAPLTPEGFVQGACPKGWAIPSNEDYSRLVTNAGGADKIKSAIPQYWLNGDHGTLPNSGFNALPGGYFDHSTNIYYNLLGKAYFWTSDESVNHYQAASTSFTYVCNEMISANGNKGLYYSLRCIRKY